MEILNYRDETNGNTLGSFDIFIPAIGLTLHRFKVIARRKGGWFFTAPSFCQEIEGEKKFFPYMTFNQQRNEDFTKLVTELLQPYVRVRENQF
jgi:hypothetical protein